jgi:hypothetical protein
MQNSAGLHTKAFAYASQLLRPENRPHVDTRYKRKVEQVVRRGAMVDAPAVAEDHPLPCPFCDTPVPEFALKCSGCRAALPYCVLTVFRYPQQGFLKVSL